MATNLALSDSFGQFETRPLTPTIGAELHGIDLAANLPDETIAEIRRALLRYKVIFFRDQRITRDQHIAFARRFGELEIHPMTPADQPQPEVLQLNSGPGHRTMADHWHSDVTWRAEPSLGSILRARRVPDVGGDTVWADMVAAFEGLSPALKEWLPRLTAVHDGSAFAVIQGKPRESFHELYPVQHHPVVRTHPETGAQALFVNSGFTKSIDGLSQKESDWLLDHLFAQVAVPEYQCRFHWTANAIAFWDNRTTQHYATADYLPAVREIDRGTIPPAQWGSTSTLPAIREMDRVTVVGDKPFYRPAE